MQSKGPRRSHSGNWREGTERTYGAQVEPKRREANKCGREEGTNGTDGETHGPHIGIRNYERSGKSRGSQGMPNSSIKEPEARPGP
eukprot:6471244-Heterocapsa_arctica.AAC.1